MLCDLTCGNVFERRAQRKASFAAPQSELRDAGLPGAKRRDADNRAVFFAYFLARQKVSRLPGRNPGLCPLNKKQTTKIELNRPQAKEDQ